MTEIWKTIPGYEDCYEVSNQGNVRSLDRYVSKGDVIRFARGTTIKSNKNDKGYMRVNLSKGGKSSSLSIHRLVALAFIDNPENKPQVNHIDGVKTNNHVSNLEWATLSEQQIHAFSIGLQDNKGSKHPKAKLTEQDVVDIRDRLSKGESVKHISGLYDVKEITIYDIKRRARWSHI